MIRVKLVYVDHVVDVRSDEPGNPDLIETMIRQAADQLHNQISYAEAIEATRR